MRASERGRKEGRKEERKEGKKELGFHNFHFFGELTISKHLR